MIPIHDLVGSLKVHKTKKPRTRRHERIKTVAVHHLGTGQKNNYATPYSIAAYHVGPNHISKTGAPTVCYALMITKSGKVYKTENYSTITWHVGALHNASALGILLLDDLDVNEPTKEMIESLIRVIGEELYMRFPQLRYTRIKGHREYSFVYKSCPGRNVDMKKIRQQVLYRYGR